MIPSNSTVLVGGPARRLGSATPVPLPASIVGQLTSSLQQADRPRQVERAGGRAGGLAGGRAGGRAVCWEVRCPSLSPVQVGSGAVSLRTNDPPGNLGIPPLRIKTLFESPWNSRFLVCGLAVPAALAPPPQKRIGSPPRRKRTVSFQNVMFVFAA